MIQGTLVIGITFCLCNVIFYCVFGKDNFRFSLLTTACLITLIFAVGKTIELGGFLDSKVSIVILCVLNVLPFLLYKSRNLIYCAVYYFWNSIYNYIGAVILGIIYPLITSAFSDNAGWYIRNEGSVGTVIAECLCMVFAAIVGWLITRKLKPVILNLKGVSEVLFIIFVPIQFTLNTCTKNFLINTLIYSNDPQGIGFIIDAISFFMWNVAIVILIINVVRRRKAERKKVEIRLQTESDKYQMEAAELKEDFREWRHDQRNLQISGGHFERDEDSGQ